MVRLGLRFRGQKNDNKRGHDSEIKSLEEEKREKKALLVIEKARVEIYYHRA